MEHLLFQSLDRSCLKVTLSYDIYATNYPIYSHKRKEPVKRYEKCILRQRKIFRTRILDLILLDVSQLGTLLRYLRLYRVLRYRQAKSKGIFQDGVIMF